MEGLGSGVQLTEAEHTRYSRHLALPEVGYEGQKLLKSARVLVVGAGGLGCPVLQYLAAAGVGTIGIADGDAVDMSNLQRQVLYSTADVGTPKVRAAAQRLAELNPLVDIIEYPAFITADNAATLVAEFDIVVDGSDNFPTRYLLNDTSVALGKPLVFGSVLGFEGQVAVFNYKGSATYRCLYPEPPDPRDSPSCSELGVLGVLPGIVGCLQANEVLKIILGAGDILAGKLLILNALTMQTMQLDIPRLEHAATPAADKAFCSPARTNDISAPELRERLQREPMFLVDVRTHEERALCSLGGVLIPVDTLQERKEEIPRDQQVVLYCHKGVRSSRAAALLAQHGYTNILTLAGGIDRWAMEADPSMARY